MREITVDAFLVLMQVGHDGDWVDRGLPEVVAGYHQAGDAREAGLQWLLENHPDAVGDDWQLLVWTGLQDKPYRRDAPTVVIKPLELRAAGAGITRRGTRRRRIAGAVAVKVHAEKIDLGDRILVTQDRRNMSDEAAATPALWAPALMPGPDTVTVRVTGKSAMTWRNREVVSLRTSVGELAMLPAQLPVIPVDETD